MMADPTDPTPTDTVPFTVSRAEANAVLAGWLRSRRFAPTALKELTGPDSLRSSYLPHWAFSARTTSEYDGQRGKQYWVSHTSTSTDANGNTTTHTHQQRHTSWRPARGTVARDFADVLVAATRALEPQRLGDAGPWPLGEAVPFQPDHLHGHRSLPVDTPQAEALAQAKAVMATAIEKDCRQDIGGDEQRLGSVRTSYTEVSDRLLLFPAWIGSYQYNGKQWQVVINGCTGEIHGDRPYSIAKVAGAILAGLAVVAAIVAAVLLSG